MDFSHWFSCLEDLCFKKRKKATKCDPEQCKFANFAEAADSIRSFNICKFRGVTNGAIFETVPLVICLKLHLCLSTLWNQTSMLWAKLR